jgi:cytochrome c oxidase subunit I
MATKQYHLDFSPQTDPVPNDGVDQKPNSNYLNVSYGWLSWLLTVDHKRIGLLYLITVSMFFVGGASAALLVRLNLLTPYSELLHLDTYNKAFTAHGTIMLFLFLIPVVPGVLGNFLVPMMIGAKDMAFPKLNLASWYVFMIGAMFFLWTLLIGGLDTGWTLYPPYSSKYSHMRDLGFSSPGSVRF